MSECDSQAIESLAAKSPSFCMYPFTHLATKTEGTFKLCCRSEPIAHVNAESALATWNGPVFRRVRQQMLRGERPQECNDCWKLEDVGTRSMRQRALSKTFPQSRWNHYRSLLKNYSDDGSMSSLPKTIELKISNLCNLKCRMCSPIDSTSWASEWPEVADLHREHNTWAYETAAKHKIQVNPKLAGFEDNQKWWDEFDVMVDHLDLVEFAGGEPLLDPAHYRLLRKMLRRSDQIRLKYSTNLTKLASQGTHVFDLWREFAGVAVYVSMDGIHGVYDYIRSGTSFELVMNNLNALREDRSLPIDELAVACTIQVYNVFQIPEMTSYFLKQGIRLHTHRVTYPNFLSVQILPQHLKSRLTDEMNLYISKIESDHDLKISDKNSVLAHLRDHLKFMNGRDESDLLPIFRDFTMRLDRIRGTDAYTLHPWMVDVMGENNRAFEPVGV